MRTAKLAIAIYICLVICLFIFFIVWYKKDQQMHFLSRPADHILTETYYAKVTIPGLAGSRLQFKKTGTREIPAKCVGVKPRPF